MPNFTLSLVFEFSSVDKESIFGSDLMSYLKTTDKGFFSDPNLEYTEGASSKAISSDTKSRTFNF